MARKVTLLYERREHSLGQRRRVSVSNMLGIDERAHERFGNDDKGNSQCGEQDLVETAYVNDTSAAVHPLQRGDWAALVTIITVVVVFDDVAIHLLSPAKKFLASLERHLVSQGV